MTWSKAGMLIAMAVILDLIRGFFQFFWFFGPALAAVVCTAKASGALATWTLGLLGTKTAALVCGGAATAVGAAAIEATAPIGVIMADAVGLISFLALGTWIIMANARIFKTVVTGPFYFVSAFAIGEIPFLGAFPVFTVVIWRLYRTQIRVEKEALVKWEKEHAAQLQQEREQQAAEYTQIQQTLAGQQAANDEAYEEQEQEDEAANDEQFNQTEAANDESFNEREIPRYGT